MDVFLWGAGQGCSAGMDRVIALPEDALKNFEARAVVQPFKQSPQDLQGLSPFHHPQ